jgi:hypothetical protein
MCLSIHGLEARAMDLETRSSARWNVGKRRDEAKQFVSDFALKTQRHCGSRVQGSPSCGAAARMNLWKAELNKISHVLNIGLQTPCSTLRDARET